MSPELIGLLGILVLFVLLLTKMWAGVAMGIVGFVGIVLMKGWTQGFAVISSVPFNTTNNYTLTVIPLFCLMGIIISNTNIGSGLFNACNAWVGHRKGGLASASIVASGVLGAITGSAMVGCMIMSKVAVPEMRKRNYDDSLISGAVTAGAPLSAIIPPSVPMIMYGILAEESIGSLFISGIVPGLILMVVYIIIIQIVAKIRPSSCIAGEKMSIKQRFRETSSVIPIVLLFILVLGGIYGGFFTTTESGAIGALGAAIIALAYRQLSWKTLRSTLIQTTRLMGSILILLIGTYIFIQFITISKIPFLLSNFIVGLNVPFGVILIFVSLMFILLGMFLPDQAIISLTVPILLPAMLALGVDKLWFGLYCTFMTALGTVTPPVGMVVYLFSGLTKIPVTKAFKGVLPFLIGMLLVIILICVFPGIGTFLPGLMK